MFQLVLLIFIFALDPDLRTGEFAIGLIDTANIVYFLSIGLAMFWITIVAIEMTRRNAITTWENYDFCHTAPCFISCNQ